MTVRLNDAEWLHRQLGPDEYLGDDDGARDGDQNLYATTDAGADEKPMTGPGEATEPTTDGAEPDLGAPPAGGGDIGGVRPGRLDRKVVVWFGGLAAVGIVISLLGAMLLYGGGKPAGQPGNDSVTQPAAVSTTAAPTPVAAEAAGVDRPLPFTASANCPAGSTSAQTLAGADPTNAFVCVRDLVDGQVIQLDLSKTYVITAISITPGWVGKDSSGASQWAQHRVVTRVQYAFNDTDHTIVVQDTGNVHGEAVQPVKHVLASKITVLILQTSRPPAETTSPAPTREFGPPGGGLFSDPSTAPTSLPSPTPILGPGSQTTTDPVDSTFAISRLKIIGHEAI
jgi:hypothetical protein